MPMLQDERKGVELVKCRAALGDYSVMNFMLDVSETKGKVGKILQCSLMPHCDIS